jgi:hypothetical protein
MANDKTRTKYLPALSGYGFDKLTVFDFKDNGSYKAFLEKTNFVNNISSSN